MGPTLFDNKDGEGNAESHDPLTKTGQDADIAQAELERLAHTIEQAAEREIEEELQRSRTQKLPRIVFREPTDEEVEQALREAQTSLDEELAMVRKLVGRGSPETLAIRINV